MKTAQVTFYYLNGSQRTIEVKHSLIQHIKRGMEYGLFNHLGRHDPKGIIYIEGSDGRCVFREHICNLKPVIRTK